MHRVVLMLPLLFLLTGCQRGGSSSAGCTIHDIPADPSELNNLADR